MYRLTCPDCSLTYVDQSAENWMCDRCLVSMNIETVQYEVEREEDE